MPRLLVRLEGLAVFAAAVAIYYDRGFGWLAFVLLLLAPDLSMVGYLGGSRLGSVTYNLAHTYVFPLALGVAGFLGDADLALQLALIWLAHIGLDRLLGYGLKYPTAFKDTHIQRL